MYAYFRDPNLNLVEAPALKAAEIVMDPEQVHLDLIKEDDDELS